MLCHCQHFCYTTCFYSCFLNLFIQNVVQTINRGMVHVFIYISYFTQTHPCFYICVFYLR